LPSRPESLQTVKNAAFICSRIPSENGNIREQTQSIPAAKPGWIAMLPKPRMARSHPLSSFALLIAGLIIAVVADISVSPFQG
jgi:hypothetical protein